MNLQLLQCQLIPFGVNIYSRANQYQFLRLREHRRYSPSLHETYLEQVGDVILAKEHSALCKATVESVIDLGLQRGRQHVWVSAPLTDAFK